MGVRAEQKRRWDRENKQRCDCGRLKWRGEARCQRCAHERKRAARDGRYRRIEVMWNDGASLNEIASALHTTRGTISFHMAVMRREGWKLPYRR